MKHSLIPQRSFPPLLAVCLFLAACGDAKTPATGSVDEPAESADGEPVTLIANARIYTLDPGGTVVDAGSMAFSDSGEILAIGDDEPMARAFPGARRVDMVGRTVLPGLIDSHGHLYGLALSFTRAQLAGTRSKDEVMERLHEFEAGLPEGEWVLGRGWDQNDWPEQTFPTFADLDAEFPDRPVWLRRIDGHAAWGNSAAMAQADQDLTGDWQPEGGHIQRDDRGRPTGIFIDGAMNLVERAVPEPSPEVESAALDLALEQLVSLGLTGVHDPGVDRHVIDLYRAKITAGDFPVRVYALSDGIGETTGWLCANGPLSDPSGRLEMRAVKLYADGALGSRGAALLADYSDDPGNRGLLFMSDDDMKSAIRTVVGCGLQAGVHAIGDAANRQVLDAYQSVLPEFPDNPGRHRIEHAQVLSPEDIPRFAELGVIAAMQPTHATSDMYWAGERLGADRLPGAYAWKRLAEAGALLAFGSDFPVEEVNPMLGIYAAVTRQDLKGWPDGGWLPDERLSREEAVRAFTLNAAYAGFAEQTTGSLEIGKRADFIVLDRDIMRVPANQIPDAVVLETWVDGQPVFVR
jgi:predicted amidohydrolase YtcJ